MSLDLDAIRQRAEAATPGPWHAWDRGIGYEVHVGAACGDRSKREFCGELNSEFRETFRAGDADFIAHAREDVPALLAEVERLRATVERVEALADKWRGEWSTPRWIDDLRAALTGPAEQGGE